jgi:hypothetical protein
MEPFRVESLEHLKQAAGREVGVTAYRVVTQAQVDAFASVTGDAQWIHVDAERAARESPYRGTIAHGFLTLSLLSSFLDEAVSFTHPLTMAVNYGLDRVRFPAPVVVATAFGNLYVMTQEYLGLPAGLPNAAGLVGVSATIESDEYVFPSTITLTGPRTYWFYADKQGDFANSFDIDTYPGGVSYITGVPTLPFRMLQASGRMVPPGVFVPAPPGVYVDANFRLAGVKK